MTYHEFIDTVCNLVRISLPGNATVSVQSIMKNNDTELDGLTITDNGLNISPTIYLNHYYSEYQNNTSIDSIVTQILSTYHDHKPENNIDISFFTDFEKIKDRIAYKLINFNKNQKLLSDVPFIQFLDLAIVFYCLISNDSSGSATILIHNHHLGYWNVDVNQLYRYARNNTPRLLSYDIKNMSDLLSELFLEELSDSEDSQDYFSCQMYVLTNQMKLNGASCILYSGILEKLSDRLKSDFYILPSSIHEVILVPCTSNDSYDELSSMVHEVNETQVSNDEILSDHVYYYSRNSKQICM